MTTETASAPAGWALAVDFGTTATTAVIVRGRTLQLVRFGSSTRMPSGVFVDPDEGLLAATGALNRGGADPGRYVRTPKRLVGRDDDVRVAGQDVAVRTLVATVLRTVLREAQQQAGGSAPDQVVLTHPARWALTAREVLTEAAGDAGMGRPILVPEPVAAGEEAASAAAAGSRVAVYDLGGGTFDAAVLDRTDDDTWVLAGRPGGLDPFGGEAIDALLHRHLLEKVTELDPNAAKVIDDPDTAAERGLARTWWRDLRAVKEDLSESTSCSIWIPGTDHAILVSREELEHLVHRPIADTVDELARTIQYAPGDRKVTEILMCGDASRMPIVDRLVRAQFAGIPVRHAEDPKGVVARGAVSAAARLAAAEQAARPGNTSGRSATETAPGAPPATSLAGWDLGLAAAQGVHALRQAQGATPQAQGPTRPAQDPTRHAPVPPPGPDRTPAPPPRRERAEQPPQIGEPSQPKSRRRGRIALIAAGGVVLVLAVVGVGAVLAQQRSTPPEPTPSGGDLAGLAARFRVDLADTACTSNAAEVSIRCTRTDRDSRQDVTASFRRYPTSAEAKAAYDTRVAELGPTEELTEQPFGYHADPADRTGSPTGTLTVGRNSSDETVFLVQSDEYVAEFSGPESDTVERAFIDAEMSGTVDAPAVFGALLNRSDLTCWPNYWMLFSNSDDVSVDCFSQTPGGHESEPEVAFIRLSESQDVDTRITELKGDGKVLGDITTWSVEGKTMGPYVVVDYGEDSVYRYGIIWARNDTPNLVAIASGNSLPELKEFWESV